MPKPLRYVRHYDRAINDAVIHRSRVRISPQTEKTKQEDNGSPWKNSLNWGEPKKTADGVRQTANTREWRRRRRPDPIDLESRDCLRGCGKSGDRVNSWTTDGRTDILTPRDTTYNASRVPSSASDGVEGRRWVISAVAVRDLLTNRDPSCRPLSFRPRSSPFISATHTSKHMLV